MLSSRRTIRNTPSQGKIPTKFFKNVEPGFTLLEVLISIAIIGIILTSLYGGFFISKKALDGLDDSLIRLQEMRMTLDMMRREVESAIFSPERPGTIFRIEGRDIYGRDASLLTITTFSSLAYGPVKVSYRIELDGDDRLSLIKGFSPFRGQPGRDNKDVQILEDVESFSVEARYKNEWVRTWDGKLSGDVPEEVRLTMVINVKGKRYALSDVARVRTGRPL